MPQLDREQRKIVRLIRKEGRKIRNPKLRKVYERAAVQTGLVESNLRNLDYGDADSQGWRQERASLYPNPTNIKASVRRFRQEFQQHYDPGEASYEVAAQVQRPAEQYRGRYKEEADEAAQILGKYGASSGGGGSGGRGGRHGRIASRPDRYKLIPGVDNAPLRQQAMLGYLEERGKPGSLLELKGSLDAAQDVPDQSVRIPGQKVVRQGGKKSDRANAPPVARPNALENIEAEMELINAAKVPYQWGGGHAAKQKRGSKVVPLDCSGAVSRVLGIDPRVSGQFETWGKPGKGKAITIYANEGHVLMSRKDKNGVEHFWGTSQTNPGGGAGWIKRKDISKEYLSAFTARHPRGL